MPAIYVARSLTDQATEKLRSLDDIEVVFGEEAPPARQDLLNAIKGKEGAIVTLTEKIDEEFFQAAGPQLKVVANVAVGFDNIDLEAAARHGVTITNTPGVLDGATADHTFALILDSTRRVSEADRFLRAGNQWIWGPRMLVGLDVSGGVVLGIIGFGRIGRAVARRAQAFDMKVIAADSLYAVGEIVDGVEIVDIDTVLEAADIVSLHVPLLPSTRHLMNDETIAKMKKGSYLINVARGGVVDEAALLRAIDSGHLRGAGLDTFENEPNVNKELLTREAIVVTPHTASAGEATREKMCFLAANNVLAVLAGESPLTPVYVAS